jgi:hypothetical protein
MAPLAMTPVAPYGEPSMCLQQVAQPWGPLWPLLPSQVWVRLQCFESMELFHLCGPKR